MAGNQSLFKNYAYKLLYEDSSLRISNNDYLTYYDYENQLNLEAFRRLDEFINQEQYADALNFMATNITPENLVEECRNYVNA